MNSMAIKYYWHVEENATAENPTHEVTATVVTICCASYKIAAHLAKQSPSAAHTIREIVLVRDNNGELSWAYIEDGELYEYFHCNGNEVALVPLRFHREVRRIVQ